MTDTAAAKQHTIRWKMVRAMCETYKSEQDLHVVYTQRKPPESTSSFQGQVEALCAKEMCTPLDRVEFFIRATMTLEAFYDNDGQDLKVGPHCNCAGIGNFGTNKIVGSQHISTCAEESLAISCVSFKPLKTKWKH